MSSGVTYRLSFETHPAWLIGSTVLELDQRKAYYLKSASEASGSTVLPVYHLIRASGPAGFHLTEVSKHYFAHRNALLRAEQDLIDDHYDENCLNIKPAFKHPGFHYNRGKPFTGPRISDLPTPKFTAGKGTDADPCARVWRFLS